MIVGFLIWEKEYIISFLGIFQWIKWETLSAKKATTEQKTRMKNTYIIIAIFIKTKVAFPNLKFKVL